ncbi:hypothetical protein GCM10027026_40620 [Myroides odoratimimus subsp. xuanwuensis]
MWLAVTALAGGLSLVAVPELAAARDAWTHGALATQRFDTLLVWLAAAVAVGCLVWLWLVTTSVALGAARGRGATKVIACPAALRRLLLAACGVALASGLAAPVNAVPTHVHGDGGGPSALEGLPLPERPADPWGAPQHLRPPPSELRDGPGAGARRGPHADADADSDADSGRAARVVVHSGDTLWGIAADTLPDDAGPAAVDERWRAIYAANAERVGTDPDLILPTTHLRLPRRIR